MTTRRGWILVAQSLLLASCSGEVAPPGLAIVGKISGAEGTPVPVTLVGPGLGGLTVMTDLSGHFTFRNLKPGDYTVTPELFGYRFAPPLAKVALYAAGQPDLAFSASPRAVLQVWGQDMSSGCQNLVVHRDGSPVLDAEVRVDGVLLPPDAGLPGFYRGCLPAQFVAGQGVSLLVAAGGLTVTGSATFPAAPTLVAPADGATLAPGGDLVVQWLSSTHPDRFDVSLGWSCGAGCGTGRSYRTAGSARTLTIPAGDVPAGSPVSVVVYAYADGTLEGDYAAWPLYPGMNLRAGSATATITR